VQRLPIAGVRGLGRSLSLSGLLTGVALLAGHAWLASYLQPQGRGLQWGLTILCWISVYKPGMQFVAHVTYFGPVVLLAALRWRAVVAGVCAQGPGLALALLLGLVFLPDPQSRHLMLFLPLVAAFTARAWQRDASWLLAPFVLAALVVSKVWLVINPFPVANTPADLLLFPAQGFFLSHGPWMSDSMYLLQGATGLLLLLWFCSTFRPPADSAYQSAPKLLSPSPLVWPARLSPTKL